MRLFESLNDENFLLYAAKYYYKPMCIDAEEFYEDLNRFKYLKRLLNKYQSTGELSHRLILNHLTVIFNIFGAEPTIRMLVFKLGVDNLPVLKPFLLYLKIITEHDLIEIPMDKTAVDALRKE